jgi:hypothetical protein
LPFGLGGTAEKVVPNHVTYALVMEKRNVEEVVISDDDGPLSPLLAANPELSQEKSTRSYSYETTFVQEVASSTPMLLVKSVETLTFGVFFFVGFI